MEIISLLRNPHPLWYFNDNSCTSAVSVTAEQQLREVLKILLYQAKWSKPAADDVGF